MPRTVIQRTWIDWDFNDSFTNESAYVLSIAGEMRLAPPEQGISSTTGIVDTCTIVLRNTAGRFSPLRTDGALYSYIADGGSYHVPVYVEISIDNGSNYDRVFTGVIKQMSEISLQADDVPRVTLTCRSIDEQWLQYRLSTTAADFLASVDTVGDEGTIIEAWLDDAGVAAGDMVIDGGLYYIPFAWLDDESPIEEIWQLAAACGGRFYADKEGKLRYENMAHWQTSPHQTSQETFTKASYRSLQLRFEDGDLYNIVTVESSPRAVGNLEVIWQPDQTISIQPGETETVIARYDVPAYSVIGPDWNARTAGGIDATSDVGVAGTYYAQRAELAYTNSSDYLVYLNPLMVLGRPVVGAPEQEQTKNSTDDGSNATYFSDRSTSRTRSIRGNPYIQTKAQASSVAQFLLHRLEQPRLTYVMTGCPGDGGRNLGDRITINDSTAMSSARTAYITAIRYSYTHTGFSQDIEALDTSDLFRNDGNYFVLGTDQLGGTKVVFY